jgi:hypothetical protein
MARKISIGNGQFIKQTNKKRPGRHAKKPNKRSHKKQYRGQGRR